MNTKNEKYLIDILNTEDAWDKKTRTLKRSTVLEMLRYVREAEFFSYVYWPLMLRAVHLCKIMQVFPDDCFQEIEVNGKDIVWFSSDLDWVVEWFNGAGSYIDSLWHGEWAYEEPSEDEILSLGVRPNMVPAKIKKGVVQESLF